MPVQGWGQGGAPGSLVVLIPLDTTNTSVALWFRILPCSTCRVGREYVTWLFYL